MDDSVVVWTCESRRKRRIIDNHCRMVRCFTVFIVAVVMWFFIMLALAIGVAALVPCCSYHGVVVN